MRYCMQCGKELPEIGKFCPYCAAPILEETVTESIQPQPYPTQTQGGPPPFAPGAQAQFPQRAQTAPPPYTQQPVQQSPAYDTVHNYTQPAQKKKSKAPVIAAAAGFVFVALCAVAYFVGTMPESDLEVTYSYLGRAPKPKVEYTVTETVFPSLYRTLDSLVTFTGTSEGGDTDVVIEMEIPGFTQKYTQKVTLGSQITKLNIKPPLLTGQLDLNNEKDAQLALSIKEAESGKVIAQDSTRVTLKSKFDVVWWTEEFGDMNNDNILAWMTPEAPGILQLKRNAVDYLSYLTNGQLNSMVGYQQYGFDDPTTGTWAQAVAIQGAMSDIEGVRYNNAAFSISSDVHQRVMLPDDVLSSKSGICIETALVMASALQSAGMHPMLIFPPGHAQVALEAWPGTGEYFLIETTVLPMPMNDQGFYNVVKYLTKEQWDGYISGSAEFSPGECYVLDCDLGQKLGILPMSN